MSLLESCTRPDANGREVAVFQSTNPSVGRFTAIYRQENQGFDYKFAVLLRNINPDNPLYGHYSRIKLNHERIIDEHAYPLYERLSIVTVSQDGTQSLSVNILQDHTLHWTGTITSKFFDSTNPTQTEVNLTWQDPENQPEISVAKGQMNDEAIDVARNILPVIIKFANRLTSDGLEQSTAA